MKYFKKKTGLGASRSTFLLPQYEVSLVLGQWTSVSVEHCICQADCKENLAVYQMILEALFHTCPHQRSTTNYTYRQIGQVIWVTGLTARTTPFQNKIKWPMFLPGFHTLGSTGPTEKLKRGNEGEQWVTIFRYS